MTGSDADLEGENRRDGDYPPDWWMYVMMVLLGPITLIGAIQADFHPHRDQLITGALGTWLWVTVALEVLKYV